MGETNDELWWRNVWVWVRFVLWIGAIVVAVAIIVSWARMEQPRATIDQTSCENAGYDWDTEVGGCLH